jgi:hypothetical protein
VAHRIEQPRDKLRVVRRAAHQLSGSDAVVIARVEPEHVVEDPVADRCLPAPAVADREVMTHRARD